MATISEYLSSIGRKGGKAATPRKQAASLQNLEKANQARIERAKAKRLAKLQDSA